MGKGGGYIGDKLTHTHPPQPQPVLQTAGGVRPCRRNRYTLADEVLLQNDVEIVEHPVGNDVLQNEDRT